MINLLITLLIGLLIVGLVLYCIRLIPGLPSPIARIAEIIVIIIAILFLAQHAGFVAGG